ncbi:MAG: DUF3078 domain-containing protein [Prevotellaceae bacterium]|jgi:hypothetical protein|nr:DUF3078 domain-containing protein [Prevotellaceae bacterium]
MRRKVFFIATILVVANFALVAQITDNEKKLQDVKTDSVSGWKFGAVAGLNFAQTKLVHWAAGGHSSLALNSIFSASANYFNGKHSWLNALDLGYGLLNEEGSASRFKWRKTDDKINLSSQYGYRAYQNFYYAALLDFKTQFARGYDENDKPISDFLAPAYLTAGVGVSYQPSKYFNVFFSPATARLVIVNDTAFAPNYSIKEGKTTRFEFGGYARIKFSKNDFKTPILKNIGITTKLDLFSNYLKNPQNIDVSWETLLAFKVNQYISINLSTNLLYDDDTKISIIDAAGNEIAKEPRVQFKEILGIGASIKF